MIDKLQKHKNLILPFLGNALAVILFFFESSSAENSGSATNLTSTEYNSEELKTYTEYLEERIENFLNEISGISNATVILTVENSSETVYATQGINSDYVLIKDSKGNENAIPLTEISAKIRGIAVVCNYNGNESLKMTVIDLLSSLFNVGANRISVLPA